MKNLEIVLNNTKFKKNKRKNVFDTSYPYMNFGLVRKKFKSRDDCFAVANERHPVLYKLLKDIAAINNFKFTTIIVNKNVICKSHTDKNNVGDSLTFSVGVFVILENLI